MPVSALSSYPLQQPKVEFLKDLGFNPGRMVEGRTVGWHEKRIVIQAPEENILLS